jgi:hypothetical protein
MDNIKLYDNTQIRTVWDEAAEEWYFSIIDVITVLTESRNPRRYWSDLKKKILEDEGSSQLYEKIVQLKMPAPDGKMRSTDAAALDGIFRIIQSIPSPKAEPFKMWLAQVGKERLDEITDPEISIDRALQMYLQKGYSREWINQRLQAIQVRKELTDTWQAQGVREGRDFAILTNEITRAWSGMSTREYKGFKNLKKENLRDNMSTLELVLNMLAEATSAEISKQENAQGFDENLQTARRGGKIAGAARENIERETGKPVITRQNALDFSRVLNELNKPKPDDDK